MWRLLPSDEKGMEVAPRSVSEDGLPFRPPSRYGRTWVQPAEPCYDPRAELQIEVSCSYPEGGTVSVLLLTVAGQVLGQKRTTRLRSPRDPVKGVGQLQQPGGSKLRTTSSFSFERTHRAGGVHPAAVFAAVP